MINETNYKKLTVKKVSKKMDGFLVNVNFRSFFSAKIEWNKKLCNVFWCFKCRLLFYYGTYGFFFAICRKSNLKFFMEILELWQTINTVNTTQIFKKQQPLTAEYLLLMLLISLRSLTRKPRKITYLLN